MSAASEKFFLRFTKSKIIIGFLFALLALILAWGISQFVFKEMLHTVDKISAPNDKLRLVNQLSEKISKLDQVQRSKALNNPGKYNNFFKESKEIKLLLDTLTKLYQDDSLQLQKLKQIKRLITDRDQQFITYLEVREKLVNTNSFSEGVAELKQLIQNKEWQPDTAVLTKKTRTTTLAPKNSDSKGFLSRLFGKKKNEPYKVIDEELKILTDTFNLASDDSLKYSIEQKLARITEDQRTKSKDFINKEAELTSASNAITSQMLQILKDVEREVLTQTTKNGIEAKTVINTGISQIIKLLIIFFVVMLILLYIILSDISKSNKYRKALELAKEEAEYHGMAKQRFLSNMSHEIRTPLQSIIGYSELILHQEKPNKNYIETVYNSSNHLLHIVNEVLDYNRIISGEFNLQQHPFNIYTVLEEVLAIIKPLAQQKDLQLFTDFNLDKTEYALGDAFRLKQILLNLLGNAVKFTHQGYIRLNVSSKRHFQYLHFTFIIEDTGIGMENKYLNSIFNEFEQIEIPEKHQLNQAGTGLGLSIVKKLVDKQEGRISVKSKPGKGTTFSFFLKYVIPDQEEIKIKSTHQNQTFKTGKVWVIDDDKLILELCEIILTKNNIACKTFNTVSEILEETDFENLTHVLIDKRMPKLSGLELYEILRKKLPETVKFYAITAQVLHDEREKMLQSGFDGIVLKPFKESDLLNIFEKQAEPETTQLELDFSSLKKMTFGDETQLQKILNRFISDCETDIGLLNDALTQENLNDIRLINHRLAGRIAQIGDKKLAAQLRKKELELDKTEKITKNLKSEMMDIVVLIQDLVKQIIKENQ